MQKDKIEAKRSYQMEKTKKDTQTQIIRDVQAQNIEIGDMQALNIRDARTKHGHTRDARRASTKHKSTNNTEFKIMLIPTL